MSEVATAKSATARAAIQQFVVRDGLSYVDAIERCEFEAEAAAAPFLEAAAVIRSWLGEGGEDG